MLYSVDYLTFLNKSKKGPYFLILTLNSFFFHDFLFSYTTTQNLYLTGCYCTSYLDRLLQVDWGLVAFM